VYEDYARYVDYYEGIVEITLSADWL
jgi:hypothetical protein